MPTATGRPTADEKREADRIKRRAARQQISSQVTTPEWVKAEADKFVAALAVHAAGVADGTIKSYERVEQWYPAGEEYVVNRVKVNEGEARSLAVGDELWDRGVMNHGMMSFGLYAGRDTLKYGIRG
jgi:hypothetical protein